MTTAKASTALAVARADDSTRRHDRVVRALDELTTAGAEITVSAVARAARVHRSFIHRHPQLHAAVTTAQSEPALVATDSAVSVASLRTELANMHAQNTRSPATSPSSRPDSPKHWERRPTRPAVLVPWMKRVTYADTSPNSSNTPLS
jgi:Family of unknown function (DUF6262)